MEHKYGHFNESGTEFTVTDPATPRAFDNFLWNRAVFSNVQQTGVGYVDYQVDGLEAIQLLTAVGRSLRTGTSGSAGTSGSRTHT